MSITSHGVEPIVQPDIQTAAQPGRSLTRQLCTLVTRTTAHYFILLFSVSCAIASFAGEPRHAGVIGLLEVAYEYDNRSGKSRLPLPLVVREEHASDGRRIITLEFIEQLESHEWNYEEPGVAIV